MFTLRLGGVLRVLWLVQLFILFFEVKNTNVVGVPVTNKVLILFLNNKVTGFTNLVAYTKGLTFLLSFAVYLSQNYYARNISH